MANDENEILNNLFAKLPIRQTPWQYVGARNKSHQRDYLKFDDAINHFIKTSEYDESRRSYIDESEVGHGFYLMDYGQYSEILSKFKTRDVKFKKQKIEELQNRIPILHKSKKFKRTILNEIENRIIFNPDLMKQARKKLEDASFFIHLLDFDEYFDIEKDVGHTLSQIHPQLDSRFFVQYSPNKIVDKFIFVASSIDWRHINNKYFKRLLKIIDEDKDVKELGKVKIDNKKMIFFHNDSFQTIKPQDYEEKIIECYNGTFSVNMYSDSTYKENIKKIKLVHKELIKRKWTWNDYLHSKRRDLYGSRLDKLYQKIKKLILDKYKIEEPGLCFYYINFNN